MNVLEYLAYNLAILGQFYGDLFEGVVPRGLLRSAFFGIAMLTPTAAQFRPERLDVLQDTLLCTALSTTAFVALVWYERGPPPALFLFALGVFAVCLPVSLAAIVLVRMLRRGMGGKAKAKGKPAHGHGHGHGHGSH